MKFTKKMSMANTVMWYESDEQIAVRKTPFGNGQFDNKVPAYIIIKDENTWALMEKRPYSTDYFETNPYIINRNTIFNEYRPILTSNSLKNCKEAANGLD